MQRLSIFHDMKEAFAVVEWMQMVNMINIGDSEEKRIVVQSNMLSVGPNSNLIETLLHAGCELISFSCHDA